MKIKPVMLSALLALTLAVTGCGGEQTADETTTPLETTAPVTEAQPTSLTLTDGGAAVYPLVRADLAEGDMIAMLQQLISRLETDTGCRFMLTTDWIKRDTVPDSSIPEILFGPTNRPETLTIAKQVGYGGYAVAIEGKKVVIYGGTADAQQKAAEAFLGAVSKNDAGELMLDLPAGGIIEAGQAPFFANGDASDYVIVAGEEDQATAQTLQTAIRKKYGYELPIKRPTDAETAREILLGDSGRKQSDTVLAAITSPIGYQAELDGEKVVLAGASKFATKQVVDYFVQNYVETDFSAVLQIPADLAYGYAGLTGAEYVELTEGADVRIMSFNLLTELWDAKVPVEGRDEIVAAALLTYLPDVIGLQEVSAKWYERLVPMVKDQYTFVNEKTAEGKVNYSGMAYNKDKVKLITTGCELFSLGNSGNMRLMNWAVFETLAGGERFALINTHLDINRTDGTPANSYRLVQAKEMGEKVLVLQKEYGCPVIITGDYNCNRNTEEYKLFVETAGVKDAQWTSEQAVNNDYKTYHTIGVTADKSDGAIDHITYTEGVTSLFYMNHIDAPIRDSSDHNPIMADLKLN